MGTESAFLLWEVTMRGTDSAFPPRRPVMKGTQRPFPFPEVAVLSFLPRNSSFVMLLGRC